MRQIAEFVAVLACGLFTGAAVYVSLVEHPARMECGVEIAAAEFPPSYHRGTILQATFGSRRIDLLHCSVACRGDVLVAGWRGRARRCYSTHSDRDSADQQTIAESHAGQAVSTNRAATRPLGQIACREERAERRGALPVCVSLGFREVSMRL
jgi:hypothetical protein